MARTKTKGDMMGFRLPLSADELFKAYCAERGVSTSAEAEEIVFAWVQNNLTQEPEVKGGWANGEAMIEKWKDEVPAAEEAPEWTI